MSNIPTNTPVVVAQLPPQSQYIYNLIEKYHQYFSKKDKLYRRVVRISKIIILFIAMSNTVVLGLKDVIDINEQIILGVILSALVTFCTAVTTYFNLEIYWMKNIQIHIQLNILRDNFLFDAHAQRIDETKLEEYRKQLENIQKNNIKYWNKALDKM